MTESSDAPTSRPHGRRARRLTPEEAAELEARAAQEAVDQTGPIPPLRGAVAAPPADAPVPKLRKFGRRARVVELADAPDEVEVTGESAAVEDHDDLQLSGGSSAGSWSAGDEDTVSVPVITDAMAAPVSAQELASSPGSAEPATDVLTVIPDDLAPRATESPVVAGSVHSTTGQPIAPAAGAATGAAPVATLQRTPARDSDGVELGELGAAEAPDPRPAPRFDGKVLHRPERTASHRILWLVWILIALAIVALVILLVTGVIGSGLGGSADAAPHHAAPALLAGLGLDTAPWRGISA
ncbi:hypothetical protein [Brachybacterium hainanense]|uniref:Peptidoglycan-binding protein n=1 Tax=Brachybacterium hainanense TaxID=1541174 RepID=A0ABV6RBN0_9MICO